MSVSKLPVGGYRARYRTPDGRQVAKHFALKKDATDWETAERAKIKTGSWIDQQNPVTVTEYAKAYAATRPHRASSASKITSRIKCHIEATPLGKMQMTKVLPSHVQAWATDRSKVLSPSTMEQTVRTLKGIFTAAVLDGVLAKNPVTPRLTIPKGTKEKVVPLTPKQVKDLAAGFPDRFKAMPITQAGLGLRMGELLGLKVQDVVWLKQRVTISEQLDEKTRGLTEPKTPKSVRTIPLPDMVLDALSAHLAQYPANADGFIFTMTSGRPVTRNSYGSRYLKAAVKKASLPENTTTQDLRHTFASWLLHEGESVIAVAELMGHENSNEVIHRYGHLMPDSEDRSRKAIDSVWKAEDQVRTESQERPGEQA